jgi:signal recognition particle receptor subunit beta
VSKQSDFITMLVLSAFSAGKTETIRAMSEMDVISAEFPQNQPNNPLTIAMDFGRLTLAENLCLYFLGQPGARRMPPFDAIPAPLMQRAGILFIVDSAKKHWQDETSTDLLEIYHEDIFQYHAVHAEGYSYVVLASKQDKDGARSPDEIRAILGIPNEIPVLPISAKTDPASVRYAVLELLIRLPQDDIVKMAIEKFPTT